LVQIARESIEVTAGAHYDVPQRRVWLEGFTDDVLRAFIDDGQAFVATSGSQTVGFAGLVDRLDGDGTLEYLYVRPAFTGRGVARRLVEAAEDAARARSMPRLWVDASWLARPVLEHLGYAVVETYQKQVRGVTFDNAWLRRSLLS
jgi:putative acetyltransferase